MPNVLRRGLYMSKSIRIAFIVILPPNPIVNERLVAQIGPLPISTFHRCWCWYVPLITWRSCQLIWRTILRSWAGQRSCWFVFINRWQILAIIYSIRNVFQFRDCFQCNFVEYIPLNSAHCGIVIDSRPATKQCRQDWPNSQEYGDTTTPSTYVVFVGGKSLLPVSSFRL